FLDGANIGATTIVGGILHRSGTNARWGTGDYLVAEADEHDGSFLRLHPTIAVVTNIDAEHLEYYGTIDSISRAFTDFCNTVPFYGYAILCGDDPNCRAILPQIESVHLTYGIGDNVSLQGINVRRGEVVKTQPRGRQMAAMRTRFEVVSHDDRLGSTGSLGELEVNAVGIHNIRNALAACVVGLCLGMRFPTIAEGLRQFDGVRRRLQVCGDVNGVTVVEDYAHHPTEISGTLEAARWAAPERIVCVFQPHLFSRTKFFCEEFARALSAADQVLITDIYPSREAPMPGVDAGLIVDAAHRMGAHHVELARNMRDVPAALAPSLRNGDLVLILGAGNINQIAPALLERLKTAQQGGAQI
ncbi:MAG TPA: UDP-N-acetylmuramate--L-alanine ligase, partial [Candidatus Hydrogenedentes bacterium]|nr:UDP-N-acetylmuramate--L-alanine ligase [Candidatus Hydrogenedentota bacterium]